MTDKDKEDIRKEYRDVIASVIRDNLARDFENTNTDIPKRDYDSEREKVYFTENLKRAVMDEFSNDLQTELEGVKKSSIWKIGAGVVHNVDKVYVKPAKEMYNNLFGKDELKTEPKHELKGIAKVAQEFELSARQRKLLRQIHG